VDRGTWHPPAIFGLLAGHGGIGQDEMERVFNMGVGMVAVVGADDADRAVDLVNARGVRAWRAGEVTQDSEGARLVGASRT
jgi:phosphoribosylformylglycinamidine cyclo-ligase